MKFLELAQKVLEDTKIPMSSSEIWKYSVKNGFDKKLESKGKTPSATLGALLYVNVRDNEQSLFQTSGSRPKRFYLKSLNYEPKLFNKQEEEDVKSSYSEKDLHSLLSYFIFMHLRSFSKTINHSTSRKQKYGEWIHPDMVACSFPEELWKSDVYDLSEKMGDSPILLMSFEIKKELSFSNLRASFFQAVSNSSWAHEGYLVVANISDDEEFKEELIRLSNSFGIGVIKLDIEDPDASEVVIPAEEKDYIDWSMVEKLTINKDFNSFISRVNSDLQVKEVRKEKYDNVLKREALIEKFKK